MAGTLDSHLTLLRRRMPELDALRGLAVLAVLFYHGFYWSHWHLTGGAARLVLVTESGWAGVDLFFTLSGFLITGILLDARPERYFRNFYIRRVLRIWPAYFGLIALLALSVRLSPLFLLASTFFAANLAPLLGWPQQYGPLWSLAVEEQFYLVWPLIIRLGGRRLLLTLGVLVLALEPLLRARAFHAVGPAYALLETGHRTWLHLDGLVLGSMLAAFLRAVRGSQRALTGAAAALAGTAVAILILGASFGVIDRTRPAGAAFTLTVISLLATALLAGSLLLGTSRLRRLAAPGVLRFFGNISYGLYLVHLLVFWLYDRAARAFEPALLGGRDSFGLLCLRFLVAGGTAVGIAVLSRRYYEEPILRLKARLAPEPEPATSMGAPLAAPQSVRAAG